MSLSDLRFVYIPYSVVAIEQTIVANMMEMLKSFRNIIADAVPRPPRPSKSEKIPPKQTKQESSNPIHEPEVFVEDYSDNDFYDTEESTNPHRSGKKKQKNRENGKEKKSKNTFSSEQRENGGVTINTQATGNVVTVVNGSRIQIGPTIYIGSSNTKQTKSNISEDSEDSEQHIKKCNLVTQLMEADVKPEHEYIDYVSKNLRKNWYNIFIKLGFKIGAIETMEVNCKTYGVEEARYKLLLRWIDKDERNTLGRLATLLWNEGEREIVKDLALRYDGER